MIRHVSEGSGTDIEYIKTHAHTLTPVQKYIPNTAGRTHIPTFCLTFLPSLVSCVFFLFLLHIHTYCNVVDKYMYGHGLTHKCSIIQWQRRKIHTAELHTDTLCIAAACDFPTDKSSAAAFTCTQHTHTHKTHIQTYFLCAMH